MRTSVPESTHDVSWRRCDEVLDSGDAALIVVRPETQTIGEMYRTAAKLCDAGVLGSMKDNAGWESTTWTILLSQDSRLGIVVVVEPDIVCTVAEAKELWPNKLREVMGALR